MAHSWRKENKTKLKGTVPNVFMQESIGQRYEVEKTGETLDVLNTFSPPVSVQKLLVPRPLGTIVLATSKILPKAPSVVKSG